MDARDQGAKGGGRLGELGQLAQDVAELLGPALGRREDVAVLALLDLEHRREGDLATDDVHLGVGDDRAPVLDGPDPAVGAVGDQRDALVAPLGVEDVEGILQGRRHAVVVLRGDEDEAVEPVDRLAPAAGLGVVVLPLRRARDGRLVEQVEVVVGEVDELVLGVVAAGDLVHDPVGNLCAEAARAGASEDDGDLHVTPWVIGTAKARHPGG